MLNKIRKLMTRKATPAQVQSAHYISGTCLGCRQLKAYLAYGMCDRCRS